jgi:DNA-directed RNA polymerase subunit beta
MTLTSDDFVNVIKYILALRSDEPGFEVDDIDHLGNRRVRTIAGTRRGRIPQGLPQAA